ncbi:MAG: uS17 family ribosomal protein [Patescibacteria group bacterium]
MKSHQKYRNQYNTTSIYPVHDEKALAKVGNEVIFEECRPISKTKRWRLIEVVK